LHGRRNFTSPNAFDKEEVIKIKEEIMQEIKKSGR
jgi:hypothetical protein